MFTTAEQVKELTGYDVTPEAIVIAQGVIESYVGRVEVEVTNANDTALLGKACAYQTVYMQDNVDTVFSQMAVTQVSEMNNMVSFRQDGVSPWVAPMAVIACNKLSWKRMRSVKTGSIYSTPVDEGGWATE